MEKNYDFRERLRQVHKKGRKNDAVWQKITGAVVDEHQIPHQKVSRLACPPIYVFQNLRQRFGFLPGMAFIIAFLQHIVGPVG